MLELKDVQKDYRTYRFGRETGRINALNKLSFSVDRGQVFGFLGPNGAGKTTTIKCIVGILSCDRGSILIEGDDVEENVYIARTRSGSCQNKLACMGD